MSEQSRSSIRINNDAAAQVAAWLLGNYYFDLRGYQPCELVDSWLNYYPANWLRLAVIEALYQGRYKAVSVEQILIIWHRRNQALYHFNYEFETLICSKLPSELTQIFSSSVSNSAAPITSSPEPEPSHSDSEIEVEQKSVSTSHPFEAFAQCSLPTIKPDLSPVEETEEVQPDLSSTTNEFPQTSNLEEEYQTIAQEEYLSYHQDSMDYSSDRSNNYPFPDLFTKLKALALQHQQLIIQQQQEI